MENKNPIIVSTFDARSGKPIWEHREVENDCTALMILVKRYRIAVTVNKDYQYAEIRVGLRRFYFEAGKEPVFEEMT